MVRKLCLVILRGDSLFGKTLIFVALIILVSACGPAMPTAMPVLPTNTPVLHTEVATSLPTDTVTPLPSNTPKPTYTPAPTIPPYETITGQSYVEGDPVRKLSLYLPTEAHRKSLTLLVQGGEYFPELVRYFAELGYPVIGFNTRDNSYLTEIQDGFCALAWAHTNADTYGFDAAQIVPVGGSMWGGNAALLGLVDDPAPFLEGCPYALPETGRVRAVIALAGVFDYSEEGDFFAGFIESIGDFMGGTPDQAPENWAMASAITWVKGDVPPFLLVHGKADTNVALHQSEKFATALEGVGADAELVLLPGVDHNTSVRDPRVFEAMQSFLERLDQTDSLGDGVGGMIAFTSARDGDYDIYVMNADGSDLRQLTDDPGTEGYAALSPDSKTIAFYAYDDSTTWSIYAMDFDGGNRQRLTHRAGVLDSAPDWSPDGAQIVFGSQHGETFKIWLMNADGSDQRKFDGVSGGGPRWSPDGRQLAYHSEGEGDAEIYVMDSDGTNQRQLTDNDAEDWWPAWSPDGAQIAFMSERDGNWEIYVMNADGTNVRRLTDDDAEDRKPNWSPDGEKIVFVSDRDGDMEIYTMNADGSDQQQLMRNSTREIQPAWWPAAALTTASPTSVPPTQAAVLPTRTNAPALAVISADAVDQMECLHMLEGHSDKVLTLAFAGNGVYIASSSLDQTIKLWDVRSGQEVHTFLKGESEMVITNGIVFSPDGRLLASAEAIWDVESKQVVHALDRGQLAPIAFSPDGSLLAVALFGQPIKLWDIASGQVVRTFAAQAEEVDDLALNIAFSPDGTLLAAGGHLDGMVRLWDVESGQVVRTLAHGTESNIHGVAFSPDGALLASAGTDYTVRLWDVVSGQTVHTLRHGSGLWSVAFSPDGRLLASAAHDSTAVQLWDVASGRIVRSLNHGDEVTSVAFSPDGTLLASGGYDNLVYVWGLSH